MYRTTTIEQCWHYFTPATIAGCCGVWDSSFGQGSVNQRFDTLAIMLLLYVSFLSPMISISVPLSVLQFTFYVVLYASFSVPVANRECSFLLGCHCRLFPFTYLLLSRVLQINSSSLVPYHTTRIFHYIRSYNNFWALLPTHIHPLLYVYPTGNSVQSQRKPETLAIRGQSPIGGWVLKQMSPLVGVYKHTHRQTDTQTDGQREVETTEIINQSNQTLLWNVTNAHKTLKVQWEW